MRTRALKPSFFENEILAKLPPLTRLFFQGLWCAADREGRLEDRPERLRAKILPYDTSADADQMLTELASGNDPFIVRYTVDGKRYIQIVTFAKHQRPHANESPSLYPPQNQSVEALATKDRSASRQGDDSFALELDLELDPRTRDPLRESKDRSPSGVAPARTKRKPDAAPTRELLTEFDRLHREHVGHPAVISGAKDAALIARLWRSHGEATVRGLMADFFRSPDPWIREHGYTVGMLVSQAAKLLARRAKPPTRGSPGLPSVAELQAQMARDIAEADRAAQVARERADGTTTTH
jgi:hypothetical protein